MKNPIVLALVIIGVIFLIPVVGWVFMGMVDYVFLTDFSVELVSWRSVVAGLILMLINGGGSK